MDIFKLARRSLMRFPFLRAALEATIGINAINRIRAFYVKKMVVVRSEPYEIEGSRMFLDACDTLGIAIEHSYEPFVTEAVKRELKAGDTAIDIGANIGYYTLIFSRLVGAGGMVFAFEPTPSTFELLKKNIALNGYAHAAAINKAVSDRVGTMRLYTNEFFPNCNSLGAASRRDPFIDIDTTSLDDYFAGTPGKVDFIKIDIEGGEYMALKGMKNILEKNRSVKIITEFAPGCLRRISRSGPDDLIDLVLSLGFTIHDIDSRKKRVIPVTSKKSLWKYSAIPGNYTYLLFKRPE